MHRSLSLLLALFVVAGCTSRYQVRGTEAVATDPITLFEFTKGDQKLNHQLNVESQSVEYFDRFTVGVLEIDDDGALNPAQYRQVMQMIRDKTVGKPATLIVFVHGWHHGPKTCDRDLCCFRRVLEQLSPKLPDENARNMVGLFIGWRGESSTSNTLSMLTC
jgi:hypothetical protein